MAKPQVVLLREMQVFDTLRDDYFKWANLPYWAAADGFQAAEKRLAERSKPELRRQLESFSLADLLLPAVGRAVEAGVRVDQRVAVLMNVEALRMQAAADGALPRTLAAVAVVPPPANPFTGKPGEYRWDEASQTAVLTFSAPRDSDRRQYSLSLAK